MSDAPTGPEQAKLHAAMHATVDKIYRARQTSGNRSSLGFSSARRVARIDLHFLLIHTA